MLKSVTKVGATRIADRIYALGVGIPSPKIIVTKAPNSKARRTLSPAIENAITENLLAKPVIVIPPITKPAAAQAAVTPTILTPAVDKASNIL